MKGVSEIISYILIVSLVVSLVSFILSWGLPYLQKQQDEVKNSLIFNDLFSENSPNSLANKLRKVIFSKTTEKVGGYDGNWNVAQKNITFSFISKASPVNPSQDWVSIYGCTKESCIFPMEPFYEVKVSSERIDNYFLVKYRLELKKIVINDKTYEILFENSLDLNTKQITISFSNIDESNGKILLVVR